LLIFCLPTFGTSVVVIATRDFVVVAADSALTHTREGKLNGFTRICKIRKEGTIYYFADGPYTLPSIKFDLFATTRNAVVKAGSIKKIFPIIEAPILVRLPDIVQYAKINSPDNYRRWVSGVSIMSIGFASYVDGTPVAAVVDFGIDSHGKAVRPTEHLMSSTGKQFQMSELGNHVEIDRFIDSNPGWVSEASTDPVQASKKLIQLEIDASTRGKEYSVGPPISILLVNKSSTGMAPGCEGECK
jgi:hypothetical protein